MRHHCRTENTDGQVQRRRLADRRQRRFETLGDVRPVGFDQQQFDEETHANGRDQYQHDCFQTAEAAILQGQHQQGVERRQGNAEGQRTAEQQMERQRTPKHFGQIGGDNRDFRQHPLQARSRRAVALAGQLRQIAPGGDAQPRTQALHDHARQTRQQHHKQQAVTEA
ncbi:hypothetical protein D3C81_1537610 [compost metagenome]